MPVPKCLQLAIWLAILRVAPGDRVYGAAGVAWALSCIHVTMITDGATICQGGSVNVPDLAPAQRADSGMANRVELVPVGGRTPTVRSLTGSESSLLGLDRIPL